MNTLARRHWEEVLPRRFAWELSKMSVIAPDLHWDQERRIWRGQAPIWPFERPAPRHLDEFLNEDRLEVIIEPEAAHPAVPPRVWPLSPQPTHEQCTDTAWHTLGDGSLCLIREAYTWTGAEPCAALVPTAAGWFLEYLLMSAGVIDTMTERGIEASDELDDLFVPDNRVARG